jgi:hypothetical protein
MFGTIFERLTWLLYPDYFETTSFKPENWVPQNQRELLEVKQELQEKYVWMDVSDWDSRELAIQYFEDAMDHYEKYLDECEKFVSAEMAKKERAAKRAKKTVDKSPKKVQPKPVTKKVTSKRK